MISSFLFFIIVGAAVLSILILVHELGHFLIAKRAGVWVEEFGLGLPPRLIGKKIGETIYSINALPLGGFVRLHGETTNKDLKKPKRAFYNKSKKARAAITSGGILANILLAIVAFTIVYSFSGIPREGVDVRVLEIAKGSPAEEAGILVGDIIRSANERDLSSTGEFIKAIDESSGESVILILVRGDELKEVALVPRADPPENQGPIGVVITTSETYFPPLWQRPFYGVYYGAGDALFWMKAVVFGFGTIFTDVSRGQAPQGIAGPVGILAIISEVAKVGSLPLINLIGIISINLAIINLIPFPPLDGSRLLSIGLEAVFGKRVLPRVEAAAHAVGMVILILLILLISSREIPQLIKAGSITNFVESVLE